jgi:hypothetical protein
MTVIKVLGIYRNSDVDRLKRYVAGLFFDRLGAAPGTLTETEMIEGIRESLGIASKERDLRRWKTLLSLSDTLLTRPRVDRTNPDVLLQESIELAHAATLACALTRGESGGPAFDELQSEGPVKLALAGGPWSEPELRAYESTYPVPKRTVLEENISKLLKLRPKEQRKALLRMIASQSDSVPDIDVASGQTLAEYMTRPKDDDEQREVINQATRLGRWNAVRLGLADRLLEPGRNAQLEEVLATILDEGVELNSSTDRETVRRQLLSHVLNSLSEIPYTEDPKYQVFDEAATALTTLYAQQAKLLEVPVETYASAANPSAIMNILLDHMAAQLSSLDLKPQDRATLDALPYQRRAAAFVAESGMQYTAALQQLWLQLLALHLAHQYPDQEPAIRQIVQQSATTAAQAPRVFEQLRDVQTDLLNVWLQPQPPPEELEGTGFNL